MPCDIIVGSGVIGGFLQGPFLLKLLLAIEPIVVLNSALCEHHLTHCPITEQLLTECQKVRPLPACLRQQ